MPGPSNASATTLQQVETQHADMVHDVQLDFYGKRLATCSSDQTVKIFDIDGADDGPASGQGQQQQQQGAGAGVGAGGMSGGGGGGQHTLVDTLRFHTGPVWCVAWGHPKFGSILASASYDGKVAIWREVAGGAGGAQGAGQQGAGAGFQPAATGTQTGRWERIKEHSLHGASVNSISWSPHELGPILACASSDGKISVLSFNNDGTWDASLFAAHNIGVNSISWAPAIIPSSLISPSTNGSGNAQGNSSAVQQQSHPNSSSASPYVKKFATGGCDNLVKIWAYNGESQTWAVEETLEGHSDWVRDVAFAPGVGLPRTYLASCGQDRTVLIWTQDAPGQAWNKKALDPAPYLSGGTATEGKFPDTVWRVSWSVTGNVLAVAAGDGKVSMWKESLKGGEWECVSEVTA